MQTPWGEIPIYDAHVHFFSHSFFALLSAQSGRPLPAMGEFLGWQMPPSDPEGLAEIWTKELDRHGVARAALIASIPADEASVEAAVVRFPDRFYGYFMLNPIASDGLERLEKALAGGRLRGVCLFPAMHRYAVHEARVRPVFEMASNYPGTVVFVHCGVLTVGVRQKLGLPSPFDMRFSNPIDLHGIALTFPQLPFVVPHFGAGYYREALMLCDQCPNVHLDTSSTNSWMRCQPEHLDLNKVFRRALEVLGPRRLLFGTDSSYFPRGWHARIFEAQSRALYELGINEAEARLIFGGNLARLLSSQGN
ncbi:MAG TPA: amidohydrolase family protein [Bryobacteraceae bacterium]|nr:amidohydrolase family protein [Bryobacteraceae bacterium]